MGRSMGADSINDRYYVTFVSFREEGGGANSFCECGVSTTYICIPVSASPRK